MQVRWWPEEGMGEHGELTVDINLGNPNPIAFGLIDEVFIHCKDSYEAMTLDQ